MIDTKDKIKLTLENRIKGKKVIIAACQNEKLVRMLCNELKFYDSNAEVWHLFEIADGKRELHFSQNEINELLELYYLYDFSDKISVISDYGNCGSLFNYGKTGILTDQEMVDALLYKI